MSKKIPIKNFYKGFYDGPHATPKLVEDGPIFLGVKNLTEDGQLDLSEVNCVSEQDFQKWTRRVVPQKNDIVFTYEAALHRYAIIPDGFVGCLGRRTALIRPNEEKIFPRFLLFYFLSDEWKAVVNSKIFSGATVDRIPLIDFPDFEVSIPQLPIQRKIAAILSAYDDLIENNKRRIALLEKMAEEIYREWFVRMRFPGHEQVVFHKGIPEGWEVVNCEQLLNTKSGKKVDLVPDGRFRVYGSNGLIGLSNQSNAENVIVIGRVGAYCGSIEFDVDRIWATDNTIIAKANPERTNNYFCFFLLKQLNLGNLAGGSAQPLLTQELIRRLQILAAPADVYRQFEHITKPIFCQIDLFNVINQNLQQTRDRLLPRLISGKLPVEDLDIQFPPSMTSPP
jgi:type I restriction enzyme, S subunit